MSVISAVLLEHSVCSAGGVFVLLWDNTTRTSWDVCSEWGTPGPEFVTSSTTAGISIELSDVLYPFDLNISIGATDRSLQGQLELRFISATEGYIQTPKWTFITEEKLMDTPSHMDHWVNVSIPLAHHAMVTTQDVYLADPKKRGCVKQWLELWVTPSVLSDTGLAVAPVTSAATSMSSEQRTRLWTTCSESRPDSRLLRVAKIHVYFHSDINEYKGHILTGFRLLFSFLKPSEIPEQLANTWNCSVPHWPRFKRHFRCNMRLECANKEDETECPYSFCDQGGLHIHRLCYFYVVNSVGISWLEAQHECRLKGGQLASLSSLGKWNGVMTWLHWRSKWRDDSVLMYVGMTSAPPGLPFMYRGMYQWEDGTIAHQFRHDRYAPPFSFAGIFHPGTLLITSIDYTPVSNTFLCEKEETYRGRTMEYGLSGIPQIQLPDLDNSTVGVPHAVCSAGQYTHKFLACDIQSDCRRRDPSGQSRETDDYLMTLCKSTLATLFRCRNGVEHVPYSLVCDHSQDCLDSSDEDFCSHPPCSSSGVFQCTNKQCVAISTLCDTLQHCKDSSDEQQCSYFRKELYPDFHHDTVFPPAVIHMDGRGDYSIQPLVSFSMCPLTHFLCAGPGYCLPLYVLCNGVYDCPHHEDEHQCKPPSCPGLYRCRGSTVCLHVTHVCDGWSQCPQHDDEIFCNLTCPFACVCQGYSYRCTHTSPLSNYTQLRFLHGSGSGIHPDDLRFNTMLIHLNLAKCLLTQTGRTLFRNLRSLDLSFNRLRSVSLNMSIYFPKLQSLSLASNPITLLFQAREQTDDAQFPQLLVLNISFVEIRELNPSMLRSFPNLKTFNLSHCHVHIVHGQGFPWMTSLQTLDVRGCPLSTFPKSTFLGLSSLRRIFADNYKVCCPAALPAGFVGDQCMAPTDEISSCEDLLRSELYRVSLAVFATLATVGNALTFLLRVFVLKGKQQSGYAIFVTHLCVSDFTMGVYLVVVGVADRVYMNIYLWKDTAWKTSVTCKVAGVLSLMSSEVSAAIICLITVDRFLAIKFPFSRLRFRWFSAQLGCLVLWIMGTVLAVVPLLPATSSWHFYSQTGICIPLPVTRQDFPGHDYAFAVMIVFNFVLFLIIVVGQLVIYVAIGSQSMAEQSDADGRSKDLAVARRLFIVVVSDFLCWFPIGLLGVLASRDTPISGEVNVGMAIFVLPLNSALNPFLYSLNAIQARRARAREQKLLRTLMAERAAVK